MDASWVREKVREGEHGHLEFKRRMTFPEKVVREMAAFANTSGGLLLIGVNDDGDVSGVKFPDEEIFVLEKALRELVRPGISYRTTTIPISEKKFIVAYNTYPSRRKMHYVLNEPNGRMGKVYVRVDDKSIQASREMKLILKARRKRIKSPVINYGEKESQLMEYLRTHHDIDLETYIRLSGLKPREASNTLINLTLANVLEITPGDQRDLFSIKADDNVT